MIDFIDLKYAAQAKKCKSQNVCMETDMMDVVTVKNKIDNDREKNTKNERAENNNLKH